MRHGPRLAIFAFEEKGLGESQCGIDVLIRRAVAGEAGGEAVALSFRHLEARVPHPERLEHASLREHRKRHSAHTRYENRREVVARAGVAHLRGGPVVCRGRGGVGRPALARRVHHSEHEPGVRLPIGQLRADRPGGRVVLTGLPHEPTPVAFFSVVRREVTITGSMIYQGEFPEAIRLLATGAVRTERLLTHRFPLDRIQDAFAAHRAPDSIKVAVVP